MVLTLTFVSVVSFILIHLFIAKLRFLSGIPRSRWLSIAGGISVAYVFLHLLPELGEHQEVIAGATDESLAFLENHVYLIALLGLTVFYGLDRLALISRKRPDEQLRDDTAIPGIFWIHIASFGLYNVLIGYLLLHRETSGIQPLIFFAIAMALHFVVSDYGLREHHPRMYDRFGRWILCGAVVGGWLFGLGTEIGGALIAVLIAFLAGGVILNVLKEELPEERESRFSAFVLGAGAYAVLLLAL